MAEAGNGISSRTVVGTGVVLLIHVFSTNQPYPECLAEEEYFSPVMAGLVPAIST